MRKVYLDNLPMSNSGKIIKWANCKGKRINFVYDEIDGELVILDYKSNGKKSLLYLQYGGNKTWIYTQLLADKIEQHGYKIIKGLTDE